MIRAFIIAWLAASALMGAEHRGVVEFGGLPVPGATVTVARDGRQLVDITNERGMYAFTALTDGAWTIHIEMLCFAPITQDVIVGPGAASAKWELTLLPLDQIHATPLAALPKAAPSAAAPPDRADAPPAGEDLNEKASDGFLVNGSMNNGASTPFAQSAAFGNSRQVSSMLFTGGLGVILENSALDARSFSLTGQDTPKPAYNHVQAVATLGGVLKIPHLMPKGVNFFAGYQWTRNRDAATQAALMPDALMRNGQLATPAPILDPATGAPFPGGRIPQTSISSQARDLLQFYPLPNFNGSYVVQLSDPHRGRHPPGRLAVAPEQDLRQPESALRRLRLPKHPGCNPNLFGFLDTTDTLGINTNINWPHDSCRTCLANFGFSSAAWARMSRPSSRIATTFPATRGSPATIRTR